MRLIEVYKFNNKFYKSYRDAINKRKSSGLAGAEIIRLNMVEIENEYGETKYFLPGQLFEIIQPSGR